MLASPQFVDLRALETPVFAIATFLLFIGTWHILYYRVFHPLRHYPGPLLASISRLWLAWHHFRGTEVQVLYDLVRKHGPVIRVSPSMLLVADSTMMPKIYHRRDTKSRFYIQGYLGTSSSVLIREPDAHAAHRRLIASPYALSNLLKMEPLLDKHIVGWIRQIDENFTRQSRPVDISEWAQYLAYDTLTDLGFRNPLGFVQAGRDLGGLIRGFRVGLLLYGMAGRLYPLTEWLLNSSLKKWLIVRGEDKMGFGVVMGKAGDILADRTRAIKAGQVLNTPSNDPQLDLLQSFLDTVTPDGTPLSAEAIRAEIFVILGAGSEGFGGLCTAFMVEVLRRPPIYTRLVQEIEAALDAGLLSLPVPTYSEVTRHLPFYVACVKESMRLNPSSATLLPRVVTPGDPDLVLNGRPVPVGTEVGCNPWICHRDPGIYGEDAEEFVPDRWLSPNGARLYEKYNLTWGYGARICLGKPFVLMELYKAPLALLVHFDIELCKPSHETPAWRSEVYGPALLWHDVWLRFRHRKRRGL